MAAPVSEHDALVAITSLFPHYMTRGEKRKFASRVSGAKYVLNQVLSKKRSCTSTMFFVAEGVIYYVPSRHKCKSLSFKHQVIAAMLAFDGEFSPAEILKATAGDRSPSGTIKTVSTYCKRLAQMGDIKRLGPLRYQVEEPARVAKYTNLRIPRASDLNLAEPED